MEAILRHLILTLTTMVALLSAQHHLVGGTGAPATIEKTPSYIEGKELFDTPSGNFDVGFFQVKGGETMAHLPMHLTATTTLPDGFYPTKDTTGLVETRVIGTQYVFYDATNKVLGTSTDQTITTKLQTKDAPLPTISVAADAIVTP